MAIPVWDGRAESLDDYEQSIGITILGTQNDSRPLLGPRLIQALPDGSKQKRLAMRLPRGADEAGTIASAEGARNLIKAFRASIGATPVTDVGAKVDKYFYTLRWQRG